MADKKRKDLLKIREVCERLNISAHTLRYWEREFKDYVQPLRSQGGHRLYNDREIRRLLEIKHLLKTEMYSISGAKNKLKQSWEKENG